MNHDKIAMKANHDATQRSDPALPCVDVDDPLTGLLPSLIMSANGQPGLHVTTIDGEPLILAVIDETGNILHSGPAVGEEAWNVVVLAYRRFLKGEGWLKVYATPEGFRQDSPRGC